jgi:hypothetical protein
MLTFILSAPRSGSTVLTALLEKKQGIVCMPESSFPQILGRLSRKERADRRWLAALYIAGTFPPTPITMDEAEECMHGNDDEILFNLGKVLARKLGRPVDQVIQVIWKTTRTIGMHAGPLATSGKFVVIHRNPLNVFESQFRVSFGKRNRIPLRYAIFMESYQNAFARLPRDRKFELSYDDLPTALTVLMSFIGVPDQGDWQDGQSAMAEVAERCSWLNQITSEFKNTDIEKRARLESRVVSQVEMAMTLARPVRALLQPIRYYFDHSSLRHIRQKAKILYA